MEICEDCIKQDVCKYTAKVEKWGANQIRDLPKPLMPNIYCPHKETKPSYWTTTTTDNLNIDLLTGTLYAHTSN